MIGKRTLRWIARIFLGEPPARFQRRIFREAKSLFAVPQPGFPSSFHLPDGFGKGLPERVVELVLAKQTYVPGARLLDVGHSNIMDCHCKLLKMLEPPRCLTGVDIADPTYDTTEVYERSIKADITATALPDKSFDLIWCISTIEHVGMDNSGYTLGFTTGSALDMLAIREMERLLAPGGKLLLTAPFGAFEDHGWFKNYDIKSWKGLLAALSPTSKTYELFFKYDPASGWQPAESSSLSLTRYHDHDNGGASGLAAAIVITNHSCHKADGTPE